MRNREHCEMHWRIRLTMHDLYSENQRLQMYRKMAAEAEHKLEMFRKLSEGVSENIRRYKREIRLYKLKKKLRVP